MENGLSESDIFEGAARTHVIGREGEVHQRVGSTMDVCAERAQEGAADGYVVLAEEQSRGRGRRDDWRCAAGLGLLMSVVLGRPVPRARRGLLSALGAVAAVEAARGMGVNAFIKWPNDVVTVGSGEGLHLRKLGGMLVEPVRRGDAAPLHVLGLGLNVNHGRQDLPRETDPPARSLRLERGGTPVDRTVLCRRLLARLDRHYERLVRAGGEGLVERWRELSCLLGRRVTLADGSRQFTARVSDIDSAGRLVVRTAGGRRLLLGAGDARLVTAG